MPEVVDKKTDPSTTAGSRDSPTMDEEHALFEGEEEVEDMEEEEEDDTDEDEEDDEEEGEEDVEGEKEVDEVEDEVEEEVVEEIEEEEDVSGEGEGVFGDGVEDEGVDGEQLEVEEGGDNEEQESEEVEDVEEEEECENDDGGEDGLEEESMEDEVESKGKEEEEIIAGSAEAAITVQEDLCKIVKSDEHDREHISLSSTLVDWNDEKHHACDTSKILSTYSKELNGTGVVGYETSPIFGDHIQSEENGIPDTLLGDSCKGIQLEKEIPNEAPEHVKNICLETHGSHPSLGSGDVRSQQCSKNDLVMDGGARSEPEIVKYDVSEKVESHLHGKTDSQMLKNPTLTCSLTPQRRPRSSSPDSGPDKMNKRLASVCVFYARGWCIKGNSCKFLHAKNGDGTIEEQAKEDRAGYSRKTGSEEIVEGSKQSSALSDSNPEGSIGCNSLLQRVLVRTYGTGSQVASHLHDPYDMHTKGDLRKPDHFQAGSTSAQEEYRKPFGKSYFESVLERQSDDAFLSRRHLIESKIANEVPREDFPHEMTISRRTHPGDSFVDSKHYSDSSSISSIRYQKNSPSAYGMTEGSAIRNSRSHFPNQESYNSHSLSGSLNLGMSGSFQLPQLDYRLSRTGKAPTFDSTRNSEYLDGNSLLDFDRRYHRDYSPDYPQSELRSMIHHDIPGDLTSRQTKNQYSSWEPSQPFRPSLAIGSKSLSSPASQYDPILDSIEPASTNARDYCFPTSQMTSFQDASFQPTKTDDAIFWEGTLDKNVYLHDSNAHAASDVVFASSKLEGGNSSLPIYEKIWNPDALIEKSNIKDAEIGSEWRNLDKNKNSKESKAYRIFHSALVDFVKDLLKPYWRDGQVSKDSHKTIVKKSVEKVLSALQSHQVPSTQEAINQYLAASKPKLLKLVEGYVHKHANP